MAKEADKCLSAASFCPPGKRLRSAGNPKYWNKLKERLGKEGSETVTNCHRLKLTAGDGKMRLTDVANPDRLQAGGMRGFVD